MHPEAVDIEMEIQDDGRRVLVPIPKTMHPKAVDIELEIHDDGRKVLVPIPVATTTNNNVYDMVARVIDMPRNSFAIVIGGSKRSVPKNSEPFDFNAYNSASKISRIFLYRVPPTATTGGAKRKTRRRTSKSPRSRKSPRRSRR